VLFVSGLVAVVLGGLGGYGTFQASHGSSTSNGLDASSRRLEAEAEAYFAKQAIIARSRAADSARLQAAADAFADAQANITRGWAADSARLQAAADAAG
jgi:prephenate dehydratase